MERPWPKRLDVPLVWLLLGLAQAEVWLGWQDGGAGEAPHGLHAARSVLALVTTASLAARPRFPLVALAVIALAIAVQVLLVAPYVSFVGGLLPLAVATFSAAVHAPRWRWTALLWAYATLGVLAGRIAEERQESELLFGALVLGCTWLAGDVVRARLVRADRVEARAISALALERGRIARELHDVIAHGVSVIGVQAGAARRQLDRGEVAAARESLLAVEEVARSSVGELARLLAVLREDGSPENHLAPQPGLDRLGDLVEQVRAAGLPVEVEAEETPTLPAGLDLVAFRVVQEALTNVIKHSGAPATVRVRRSDDSLVIDVDNGPGVIGDACTGIAEGHGLVGMRERVQLYGGTLDVGPRPDGGFRVAARLPLTGAP